MWKGWIIMGLGLALVGLVSVGQSSAGGMLIGKPMLQGPHGRTPLLEAYPQVARGVSCTAKPIPEAHYVGYTCSDGSRWSVSFDHVDRQWVVNKLGWSR